MQRLGTPENIAGLVSYLASDEADFMTGRSCPFVQVFINMFTLITLGQSISINGGLFYD
jgi:NAD(P)-dependent dehydrogenase (short-subunit alcohol dehydrogenase family)